jgi:type I restriction enzyme, R subunit
VLWGDDGKPLALIEAKRTTKTPSVGQQQAKLYADCLEQMYGQRPVIFYSNGYEHWLWDDTAYPPRPVQGFYKKDELELAIQRRSSRKSPAEVVIDASIVERYYQTRAVRKVGHHVEADRQDPHGDCAGQGADGEQLGQARVVLGRPGGLGQPGGQCLQETLA